MSDLAKVPKKVTQDDVAQRAGVTRSVVSYVLSNSRAVAPETRERILTAIEELGYRPNKFAQGLGLGTENPLAACQIGIILNNAEVFLRPYYTEILAGIHAKAHEMRYHIRFIRFFEDLKDPVLFNSLIHGEEISGLILMALDQSLHSDSDHALIAQIRDRLDNIVCVEWQYPGLSSVTFDRQEAARTATLHLTSMGHRSIGYIGESDERISGFRRGLFEGGIETDPSALAPGGDLRGGYDSAASLLPKHPELTAIVAGSDEVAIGVLRWLAEHQIAVPETVSVISIDNIEMAEFTHPPLTSIHVEKTSMGRQAVQRLLQHQSGAEEGTTTTLLPSRLVIRHSCAFPRDASR